MLPYLAQGAAQSFEDAAVLRQCLAQPDVDIATALEQYESIREPRVSIVQAKTREHQHILHVYDGEEQQERDEKLKLNTSENPVFWGFDDRRNWLFGHDAEVIKKTGANWKEATEQKMVT